MCFIVSVLGYKTLISSSVEGLVIAVVTDVIVVWLHVFSGADWCTCRETAHRQEQE